MASEKLVIDPKRYRGATAVLSARLPKDMIDAIDEVAEDTGYNRNEVIQKCLEFALSHKESSSSRTDSSESGRKPAEKTTGSSKGKPAEKTTGSSKGKPAEKTTGKSIGKTSDQLAVGRKKKGGQS